MIECRQKLIMEPHRMEFLKKTLSFVAITGLLAGCQITEEEKEKLEQAGENLEKIASAPFIAYPAENDTIEQSDEVRLLIDDSVDYKSMALIVDGIEVAIDEEAPYEFQWDPYYWSENEKATLIIRAITAGDNLLRSEVRTVEIGQNAHNLVKITDPLNGQVYRNINSTDIAWNARVGAESYDVRVNGVTFNTGLTSANIDLPSIGDYSVSVRAINAQGNQGKWSDVTTLSLAIPSAPSLYNSAPVAGENDWQVSFNWSGALTSSEIQIATDVNFTSILENEELEVSSYSTSLVTGIYYARTRTKNEFGYISHWSDVKTLELGLFSTKVDMNTFGGWSSEDLPIDFVVEDEGLAIVASRSNENDGSSDDFYVSKLNLQGEKSWGKSYKAQLNYPKSITKTSDGFVLIGRGNSWRDNKIIALDDLGNQLWLASYNSVENLSVGAYGIFTQERIENITEVLPSQYVALQRTYNCLYTSPANDWGYRSSTCPIENIENKVKFIDRSGNEPVITDHLIAQPASGQYDQFNQLLLTDSGLYAAGRYTAINDSFQDSSSDSYIPSTSASGAVLLNLAKTNGRIISIRTAGGIKGSPLNSIAETKSGDIVVGYNNYYTAVTSIFKPNDSSDGKGDGSRRYAQVSSDPHGDGYVTLTQHRNNEDYYLTRYNSSNVKLGESKRLAQCFTDLKAQKIKAHPKHGLVILGTDRWGDKSSDTHTVYFNVTKDFNYICPE